jgi:hypothetical protein
MATEPHTEPFLPYVVVETDEEWRRATDSLVRRWVIVNGRGETVSLPVVGQSAFTWCAALMWWHTQSEVEGRKTDAR